MWIYIAVATVVIVVAAWFVVITVSSKLRYTPEKVVFDIDKATEYVADNLPPAITGKLSYADVELLIKWELTYLRQRGVASYGSIDFLAEKPAKIPHDESAVASRKRRGGGTTGTPFREWCEHGVCRR